MLAALVWLPRARGHTAPPAPPPAGRSLLGNALAWQMTAFFGLQSLWFYAVLAWLPSIYRSVGFGAAEAGLLLGVSGLAQLPVTLALPHFATRAAYLVGTTSLVGAGAAGVLFAPTAAPYLWVILIGVGHAGQQGRDPGRGDLPVHARAGRAGRGQRGNQAARPRPDQPGKLTPRPRLDHAATLAGPRSHGR